MKSVLILYATREGQTARIAHRLADVVRAGGVVVDSVGTAEMGDEDLRLASRAAVVVGSSVHFGRHPKALREFVRREIAPLERVPTAFFSVCMAAAGSDPAAHAETRGYVDAFLRGTGWSPQVTTSFAGALAYTRYRWWIRWVMRRIAAKKGLSTDTSRDHEYTDWGTVEDFGRGLVDLAGYGEPTIAETRPTHSVGEV